MRLGGTGVAFVLLVTACGGQNAPVASDAGSDGNPVIPATPCGAFAQAWCAKRQACTNGTSITRDWGDMSTCLAREELSCTNSLGAPRTGKTTALVEQCTTALSSASCADYLDNDLPAPCNPTGPGAEGATCTFNAQCASGYCSGIRYATCGTCGTAPAAGDSCAKTSCGLDQACIWNADVTNVCEPYVSAGATCGAFSNPLCAADLGCAGASTTTGVGGTCQPALRTVGATCGSKNMGLNCDGNLGLWCLSSACGDVTYAENGMPCGYVGSGVTECNGGTCYSSGGPYFTYTGATRTGTCKAYAEDGAPCDTSVGPACLSPARCVSSGGGTAGTCVVPTPSLASACP
jgi:hypothetical protein